MTDRPCPPHPEPQECAAAPLAERDRRLRLIVDTLRHFVWTCRPDGPVGFCTSWWTAYTDGTLPDLHNDGWTHCLPPDAVAPAVQAWQEAKAQRLPDAVEQRVRGRAGRYRRFLSCANRRQTRAPHDMVRPRAPRARSSLGWAARRLTFGALGTLLLPLTSAVSLPLPPVALLYSAPVLAAEEIRIGPPLGSTHEEPQRDRRIGTRGSELVLVQSDSLRTLEQLHKQGRAPGISFDANGRITIAAHPNFNPDAAQLIADQQILEPAALQRVLEQSAARHTILMRMKGGAGIAGVHFTDPSLSAVRLWRPNANYTVPDDELLRSAGYFPPEGQLERSLAHAEVLALFHQGILPNVHISEYHALAAVRPSTYYHGAARDAVERTGIYEPATFTELARASDALIVLARDAVPGILWNADGTIASVYAHPGYATYRSADGLRAHDLVVAARYGGPTADEQHSASVQLADLHRQLATLGVKMTFDPERPGAIHYEHKWWPEIPGEPARHERAKELVRRALGVEFSPPRPVEPAPLPPSRQLRLDAEELLWKTLRSAPSHR